MPPINAPAALPRFPAEWLEVEASAGADFAKLIIRICNPGMTPKEAAPHRKIVMTAATGL
ncbi:hypothetical protein D3C73_1537240 [compost metagenome]